MLGWGGHQNCYFHGDLRGQEVCQQCDCFAPLRRRFLLSSTWSRNYILNLNHVKLHMKCFRVPTYSDTSWARFCRLRSCPASHPVDVVGPGGFIFAFILLLLLLLYYLRDTGGWSKRWGEMEIMIFRVGICGSFYLSSGFVVRWDHVWVVRTVCTYNRVTRVTKYVEMRRSGWVGNDQLSVFQMRRW